MSAEASAAIKDASAEAEAAYTGVNLDSEASNLIQQQQAYQASARILQTARGVVQHFASEHLMAKKIVMAKVLRMQS